MNSDMIATLKSSVFNRLIPGVLVEVRGAINRGLEMLEISPYNELICIAE